MILFEIIKLFELSIIRNKMKLTLLVFSAYFIISFSSGVFERFKFDEFKKKHQKNYLNIEEEDSRLFKNILN